MYICMYTCMYTCMCLCLCTYVYIEKLTFYLAASLDIIPWGVVVVDMLDKILVVLIHRLRWGGGGLLVVVHWQFISFSADLPPPPGEIVDGCWSADCLPTADERNPFSAFLCRLTDSQGFRRCNFCSILCWFLRQGS